SDLIPLDQLAERPLLAREELCDQAAVIQLLQGLRPRPDLALGGTPHDVDHRCPQSGKRAVAAGPATSLGPAGHRVGRLGCRFRTMRPLAVRARARSASHSGTETYDSDAPGRPQTPCPQRWTGDARKWTLAGARGSARATQGEAGRVQQRADSLGVRNLAGADAGQRVPQGEHHGLEELVVVEGGVALAEVEGEEQVDPLVA